MILFDECVYNFLMNFYSENITFVAKFFTSLGSTIVIITGILSILILFNKKYFKYTFIACLFGIILNIIIKNIVKRVRPSVFILTHADGYSFPSSHTMMSTIFYGLLIYFICNTVKSKRLKMFLSFLIGFIIIGIGLSRIYLGVHYATDVAAGFIIGLIYLFLFIKFYISKSYNKLK